MERTTKSVDDHLAAIDGGMGEDMRLLDEEISRRMPGRDRLLYEGKFWGGSDQQIVGYGVMDYTNRSGTEVRWFAVGLAAQKALSFYGNSTLSKGQATSVCTSTRWRTTHISSPNTRASWGK